MSLLKNFILFTALFLSVSPIFALSSADSAPQESLPQFSEENEKENIKRSDISADFSVLGDALMHNGWGLGLSGEYLFTRYFSINGTFSHSVLFSDFDSTVYTTESLSLNFYCYPFGLGLDKYLYLGGGNSTDFIQFNGTNLPEEESRKTAIFMQARAGWRQPLGQYFGLEAYAGYKWRLYSADVPEECEHLIEPGFFFGFGVHLKFGNIFKSIRKLFRGYENSGF